jgi:hypothetical protein
MWCVKTNRLPIEQSLFVPFVLAFVLTVLQFTASDYPLWYLQTFISLVFAQSIQIFNVNSRYLLFVCFFYFFFRKIKYSLLRTLLTNVIFLQHKNSGSHMGLSLLSSFCWHNGVSAINFWSLPVSTESELFV